MSGISVQKAKKKLKMNIVESEQKPYGQQQPQDEQLISAAQRALIQQAIELSKEQSRNKFHGKSEGLKTKYRKMIVNLKMGKSSQKCTICIDQFAQGEIIKRFPCGHIFHRECAKSLMKVNKKCPVCRFDLEDFFSNLEKTGNVEYPAMHDSKIKPNPKKISH